MLIPVMTGSITFVADLMRELPPHADRTDHRLQLPGHLDDEPGSHTRRHAPARVPEGRHVLIIDDILDSGRTIRRVREEIESRSPRSVRSCVLLRKRIPEAARDEVRVRRVRHRERVRGRLRPRLRRLLPQPARHRGAPRGHHPRHGRIPVTAGPTASQRRVLPRRSLRDGETVLRSLRPHPLYIPLVSASVVRPAARRGAAGRDSRADAARRGHRGPGLGDLHPACPAATRLGRAAVVQRTLHPHRPAA